MSAILTVTVNPSLDMTTTVPRLAPQRKLRCGPPMLHPGGGGANVSRAIRELGGDSRAFVALGGRTGQQYGDLLEAAGVAFVPFPLPGETRTSMTVMEEASGLHYRFVLPGAEQDRTLGEEMLAELGKLISTGVRYVVGSGSLLPGLADDFYARLGTIVHSHGAKLLLDTHGTALRAALPGRPFLIRMNEIEARELAGDTASSVAELAATLVAREAAEIVVIGLGAEGSLITTAQAQFSIAAPAVKVHSMVGAGDSYVAALVLALSRDWSVEAANRFGVAAAASAVTREATQLCDRASTEALYAQAGQPVYLRSAQPQAAAI